MDVNTLIAGFAAVGGGLGGWVSGRMTGRSTASQIANDTVDMLQTQVDILKTDKNTQELELTNLRTRVEFLEGLVTQRAEVEELSNRVSLVKQTVDRIAIKVGA